MLKDEFYRRKPASPITASSNSSPKAATTQKTILSYLSTNAGQKFLDDLEKEALARKKAKEEAILSKAREGAQEQPAKHSVSLVDGREVAGDVRKSRTGPTKPLDGSATDDRCGRGGNKAEHVQPATVEHVDTSVWNGDVTSQSTSSHLRGAAASAGNSREGGRGTADGDVSVRRQSKLHACTYTCRPMPVDVL
jgi:hypothetical protein